MFLKIYGNVETDVQISFTQEKKEVKIKKNIKENLKKHYQENVGHDGV